ncbi:hypothetical protein PDENDC454_04379 [Paenibacillus dendritiformis C454]|uniref:Phage gp6-like head-tail connector protein n=1 Tax=Paenibacillus dendritiformis C454 TaxID=1131935 RepID=H3SBJ0_9BACL|nr:hypothetical protein [Paenibacillus dendritiformis]EHQ63673.1 hypothetical protein PDENDC454_04379 [Paenibacillus dendritiformis C454]
MITTLERAKKMLGLPDGDLTLDYQLETQLIVAAELIEEHCRRKFKRQVHQELCDMFRGNYLLLRNYPIHGIEEVITYNGNVINDYTIAENGMLFRRGGWPQGERSISVIYEAGYTLHCDETPEQKADIPRPLEMACAMYAQKLMDSTHVPLGIKTEKLGEMWVTYDQDHLKHNIPPVVASLVSPYKRWR